MARVTLENVTKIFDVPGGQEVAVDDVELSIDHGEFATFVGPSGCGKTTLLRMIAGLETPTEGKIFFGDEEVTQQPPQERDIAMVFQNVALYPHMTVRQNIGFPLRVRGETENYEDRIEEVAQILEIGELLDKKPGQLSGGQGQRVGLGRAIIRDPNVILLDEPMSDLDAKLKAQLRVEFQRVHRKVDATIIYVTHDQEEAMTMSTLIALMRDGQIEQVASPLEIFDSPANEFSAQFIGQPPMTIVNATVNEDATLSLMGGQAHLDLGEYSGEFEADDHVGPIRVGFRPKDVVLTDSEEDSVMTLDIEVAENVGDEFVLHLVSETGENIDALTEDERVIHQESVHVETLQNLYFFDPTTGDRINRLAYGGVPVASS